MIAWICAWPFDARVGGSAANAEIPGAGRVGAERAESLAERADVRVLGRA